MTYFPRRKTFIRAMLAAFAIALLSAISVFAIDELAQGTITISYYGETTTFEALDASGKETHCVTNRTDTLKARGVFDIALDTVVCFDTIAEADSFFFRQNPEFLESTVSTSIDSMQVEEQYAQGCSEYLTTYSHSGYYGVIMDVCSDQPYYGNETWSIQESAPNAAMRLYRGANYTNSSWLVAESHFHLSSGWGGFGIRSIDDF